MYLTKTAVLTKLVTGRNNKPISGFNLLYFTTRVANELSLRETEIFVFNFLEPLPWMLDLVTDRAMVWVDSDGCVRPT